MEVKGWKAGSVALCIIKCYRYLVSRQDWSFPLSASPLRLIITTNSSSAGLPTIPRGAAPITAAALVGILPVASTISRLRASTADGAGGLLFDKDQHRKDLAPIPGAVFGTIQTVVAGIANLPHLRSAPLATDLGKLKKIRTKANEIFTPMKLSTSRVT